MGTEDFEAHRPHLTSVAYRMLGSRADAEDAVQEAWLRWAAADRSAITDPRAWLTTVTGRICLDVLRSARVRRETYIGQWLPEPLVERMADPVADPAEQVAGRDEVSFALLVLMERLSPEQRVAFVLHDVFAVPFDAIARALDATPAAVRQHASRARRAIADGGIRHTADLAEQRAVLAAFIAATEAGDIDGLLAILAPDVVVLGDSNGLAPVARKPVTGAVQVARFMIGLARTFAKRAKIESIPVLVNGSLGFMARLDDQPAVMMFAIADGRITGIFDQLNPEKLTRLPH